MRGTGGGPMKDQTDFVTAFANTVEHLCSTEQKADKLPLARLAIQSLFELHQKRAPEDIKKNSFYANHGTPHVTALANNCQSFFADNFPSEESPYRSIECLVLLFAAFLFHDIGMTMMSQTDIENG